MSRWISSTGLGFFGGGQGKKSRVSGWVKCRLAKVVRFFGHDLFEALFWVETATFSGKHSLWTKTKHEQKIEKRDVIQERGSLFFRNNFSDLVVINCRAPVSQHKQNCHKTGCLGSLGYNDCHGWCWLLEIYLFVHATVRVIEILNKYSISIIFIEASLLVQDMSNLSVLKRRPWKRTCEKKIIRSSENSNLLKSQTSGLDWKQANGIRPPASSPRPFEHCLAAAQFLFTGHFFDKMGLEMGFWDTRKCKGYYNIKHLGASRRRRIQPSNSRSTT